MPTARAAGGIVTGKGKSMTTPRRTIRLTDAQVAALELLGDALGSVGQSESS